jgi:hypothetical protein
MVTLYSPAGVIQVARSSLYRANNLAGIVSETSTDSPAAA